MTHTHNYMLVLLTFFIIIDSYSQDNNYKATYEVSYKPSKVSDDYKKERMLLFINSSNTIFLSEGRYKIDSLLNHKSNLNFSNFQKNIPKTSFNYIIEGKTNSSEFSSEEKVFKDNFQYTEDVRLNWLLKDERKKILNYTCQKATTEFGGRKYIAWFTSKVPISAGPYKFNGLPGLIVKIYDNNNDYEFNLIAIEKLDKSFKLKQRSSNIIKTDKKEFLHVLEEFNKNPYKRMEQSGIKISFPDESRKVKLLQKHRKEMKERNPIELENMN